MARTLVSTMIRSLWLASAVVVAMPASAQEDLTEVVVTARKVEERLQDIPASITAISGETIDRLGVKDIRDVAKLTPGLVFDLGFIPQDTRAQIRGLPATRGRPPVGMLIDNIDVSSESMQTAGGGMIGNIRAMDIERIEVLKGPQSALYGRAAFAGAVNYVTAKPKFGDSFISFNGDVGNYGKVEGKFVANGQVTDNFALRGSVSYANFAGFYRNSVSGAKIGGSDSIGGTLAGLWNASQDFKLDFRVAIAKDKYQPRPQVAFGVGTGYGVAINTPSQYVGLCLGLVAAGSSATPQASCTAQGGTRVNATAFAPRSGPLGGVTNVTLSLDPLTGQDYKGTSLDSALAAVHFDWKIGNGTLSSWSGFAQGKSRSIQDVDSYGAAASSVLTPTPGSAEAFAAPNFTVNFSQVVDFDTTVRQINQELRFETDNDGRFNWGVGAQYWRETIEQFNYAYTSTAPATTTVSGVTIPGPSVARAVQILGRPPVAVDSKETNHVGIYATADFKFTDRLSAGLRARFNDEDFKYQWLSPARSIVYTAVPATASYNVAWSTIAYARNNSSFSSVTPQADLDFKLTDDVLLYARAAKGFKAGGFITLAGTPQDFAKFDPETLWSYELGVKSQWLDRRLTLNANLFFMDNKDKLFTTLEPDTRSATGTNLRASNLSDAESKGIELEVAASLGEHWQVSGALTYIDAKYTRYAPLTTGTLGIAQAGNCTIVESPGTPGTINGVPNTPRVLRACITDLKGLPLERAPDLSAGATLSYRRPVGDSGWKLLAEASAQYMDSRTEGANVLGYFFNSYTNVDARVGINADHWSMFLYADNVFDDDTIRSGQAGGDFARVGNTLVGGYLPDKREVGLKFSFKVGGQ